MDKRAEPVYMLPQRDPSQTERYPQTKNKGMEKIFHENAKGKKA